MSGGFQFLSHELGAVFHQIPMLGGESGREVAVDVQLSDDLSMDKDWHNDLRLGLERTRQITRIFADVINYDRLTAGRCRAAMP